MSDEIDNLILRVLALLEKGSVNVDTDGVAELSDGLTKFATRYSCEEEMRAMKHMHLPYRSGQRMTDGDVVAIIKFLLSKREKYKGDKLFLGALVHPEIMRVAGSRMESGHYADAVEAALKEVCCAVKSKVEGKLDREYDGANLMNHVFSLETPILLVEDNLDTLTNKDTQKGYMMMFSGAMSGIRNPKAHENLQITREDAIRKLMFASMLMYKLDKSKLKEEGS